MTSARTQTGTENSRRGRYYAIAAVLAVVALVAGGVYTLASGKLGGIITLGPKPPQQTLVEAITAHPTEVVKTVFGQIGVAQGGGQPTPVSYTHLTLPTSDLV